VRDRRLATPGEQITPRIAQVATEALYGQNGETYVRGVALPPDATRV